MADDRPIGLMLVGRHCDESTIFRAAAAFERSSDWTTLRLCCSGTNSSRAKPR